EVEKELSVVKSWIQETRDLLLNPSPDIQAVLQELEVVHADVVSRRQNVDRLAEQQQTKYLDLFTILPSEISMQLAEVSLALGAIEDQTQRTREVQEHLASRMQDLSERLRTASSRLKDRCPDVDQARDDVKTVLEDLDACGRTLAELDAAVQDLGRRSPLLAKQLGGALGRLSETQHQTVRLSPSRLSVLWVQAVCYLDEYSEMRDSLVRWTEKARSLLGTSVLWTSSLHLTEQIRLHQAVLRESRDVPGDLESMAQKVELLSDVLQVEPLSQQLAELSRRSEELRDGLGTRLQGLQDAHKTMEALEVEVKALHSALQQVRDTLTSPELSQQGLKEQLVQRQRLLADMDVLKQQVQAVQRCQAVLQVPEDVLPRLSLCRTALRLQQDASQLQHVAIQQCNILQ
uniref:Spectrin repeat containing, nuclear envelope 1b n=1 Tax=Salarias fasciatus TaxID=181472 RepID=A0A672IKQ2_SALFA